MTKAEKVKALRAELSALTKKAPSKKNPVTKNGTQVYRSRSYAQKRADMYNEENRTQNASVRIVKNAFPENREYGFRSSDGYEVVFNRAKKSGVTVVRGKNPALKKTVYSVQPAARGKVVGEATFSTLAAAKSGAQKLADEYGIAFKIVEVSY